MVAPLGIERHPRAALGGQPTLVICGHVHWDRPLVALASGPQLLNVDARVVLLERAP